MKKFIFLLIICIFFPIIGEAKSPTYYSKPSSTGCSGWNCGFDTDTNIVSLYKMENSAWLTDTKGNNNLSNGANTPSSDTTNYKEGSASVDFDYGASPESMYKNDADLSSDFPCKSGTSNTDFSVSFWLRPTTINASYSHGIVGKWDSYSSDRSFWMGIHTTGVLRFQLGYYEGSSLSESKYHDYTLSTNTWYHASFSYRNSDRTYAIRLRSDTGSTLGTDQEYTWTHDIYPDAGEFTIGCFYYQNACYSTGSFDGQVDEVVVWKNKFLNATDATNIATGEYK